MGERRRIAVLTTGRQDYGILRSSLLALRDDARVALAVWVGGMHLDRQRGHTVELVRADQLPIEEELDFLANPPDAVADAARALLQLRAAFLRRQPDVLVLAGDRTETLAAAFAATMLCVPIAHLHGGEESEGAIDNVLRHAITKLSHLHLVAHESYAARVRQMGEPDGSVRVVGAPALDNLLRPDLPDRAELEGFLGLKLEAPVVVVTVQPTTLGTEVLAEVRAVAEAMQGVPATYVITEPNSDTGAAELRDFLQRWAAGRERVRVVQALGERRYHGLLRLADCVLGNSSSGLIEAPAFGLPVVNVGDRQTGRLRSPHVVDVRAEREAVARALVEALGPERRQQARVAPQPFPPGPAAPRIVEALATFPFPKPPRKRFVARP